MSYSRRNRIRKPAPVLVEENFTNTIGQVIKPGDEVVIVTTSTSRVIAKRGVYIGTKNKNVSCKVLESTFQFREKASDEIHKDYYRRIGSAVPYPRKGIDFVNYNDGSYTSAQNEWRTKYKQFEDLYTRETVPYYRGTTLQRNRIYKLDTSVFNLEL